MNRSNSFLRWAGSKQKLLPTLRLFWDNKYERYLEPFMGSAQLFFSISPKSAILSDLNEELIEVFNQIKKNPYPVYRLATKIPISEKDYYDIRSQNPEKLGINQRAARFIYLNQLCFNGLFRTNKAGSFNVPFGKKNPKVVCDYAHLKSLSQKLLNAKIIAGDFEKVIYDNVRRNDFIYLDPPYAIDNVRIFKQYGPETFGKEDLQRLSRLLDVINERGAYFLLSYAFSEEAVLLFRRWHQEAAMVQRNIAGFSRFRRKEMELMVTNVKQ